MQMPNKYLRSALALSWLVMLSACGGSSSNSSTPTPAQPTPPPTPAPYQYSMPLDKSDGWESADAESAGVNIELLESLMSEINDNTLGFRRIDGIAIAQHGKLIFEQGIRTQLDIGDGWANNTDLDLHVINSVTKSVMSLAVGIAIEQGLISGLDASVYDYLPAKQNIANWDESKANITVKNYLTMRHGYEWDEWNVNYLNSNNLNARMNNAADPIQFLLDRPMATEPGTTFAYSTGVSYALGVMVANASGMRFFDYLNTELLQPLNITKSDYWSLQGELHAGSALYLTLRDMAKFGQLVLDHGRWQGVQLVSESWIADSTAKHIQISETNDVSYGYQWWGRTYQRNNEALPVIAALGFGGQLIYVFRDLEAVIVFTGHRYNDGDDEETSIKQILEDYILPSLPHPEDNG